MWFCFCWSELTSLVDWIAVATAWNIWIFCKGKECHKFLCCFWGSWKTFVSWNVWRFYHLFLFWWRLKRESVQFFWAGKREAQVQKWPPTPASHSVVRVFSSYGLDLLHPKYLNQRVMKGLIHFDLSYPWKFCLSKCFIRTDECAYPNKKFYWIFLADFNSDPLAGLKLWSDTLTSPSLINGELPAVYMTVDTREQKD